MNISINKWKADSCLTKIKWGSLRNELHYRCLFSRLFRIAEYALWDILFDRRPCLSLYCIQGFSLDLKVHVKRTVKCAAVNRIESWRNCNNQGCFVRKITPECHILTLSFEKKTIITLKYVFLTGVANVNDLSTVLNDITRNEILKIAQFSGSTGSNMIFE